MMYSGIYEKWSWFTKDIISEHGVAMGYKPIEEATQEELWQMIAMASRYWEVCYRRWYHEEQENNNYLNQNY